MGTMSLNEAINIAQRMENHFRAFAKLGEMLGLLSQAEQVVVERQLAKEKLDKEITAQEEVLASLRRDIPKVKREVEKKSRTLGALLNVMRKEYGDAGAALKRKHSEFLKSLSKKEAVAKEAHDLKMGILTNDRDKMQLRVNDLQKSLDALLSKVKNLEV